jgi:N-acetylglucosamine-6-sulfatase
VRRLLKRKGTAFSNFLVAVPSYCPSRASILRGQYAHNHGVLRDLSPNGGFQTFRNNGHEESNVATLLDAAGYQTGLFGKYFNEYDEVDPRHIPEG